METHVKKQLATGVLYTAAARLAGVLMTLLISGVLSRLLTPEEYGILVPITVIVAFFSMLGDVGISPAIIQNKELSDKNIESIFSFTLIVGAVLSAIMFSGSWTVARINGNEVYVLLCQMLTATLFFSCAAVVPNALLYKAKMFGYLAWRTVIVQLVAGAVAIVAAFLGAGIYALALLSVMSSVCMFIISYRKSPVKFSFRIEGEALRKIRNFSSYQFLFNIFNYFTVNLDKLLMNKFLGTEQLGYYDKSYRLMQMPMQTIPFIITPVMHPVFSDMQHNRDKMREAYSKVVRLLSFIGFPLSVLLYFTGHELIFTIFGSQWGPAVPAFGMLALSVGFQILLATSGSIFQSCNSTHLMLLSGILSTVAIAAAILAGLTVFHSTEAVAAMLLAAFAVNFLQCFAIMYRTLFGVGLWSFLRHVLPSLILSAVMAAVLFPVSIASRVLCDTFWGNAASFGIKSAVAAIVAAAYLQLTGEYDLKGMAANMLAKIKGR